MIVGRGSKRTISIPLVSQRKGECVPCGIEVDSEPEYLDPTPVIDIFNISDDDDEEDLDYEGDWLGFFKRNNIIKS